MPACRLADVNIYYEDIGYGEPILFLHSHYNRGILAFACQMQVFHKKYRCILPDMRGHGRTTSDNSDWNIPMSVEDMMALLDSLHIDKVHLIGYGGGAVTAFHIAIEYPHRVASLVSIGYAGIPYDGDDGDEYLAEGLLRNKRYDIINEQNRKHFDAHGGNWQDFLKRTQMDDAAYNDLGENNIRSIVAPILIIAGEHDDQYSNAEHHKKIKEYQPRCEILVCKGEKHNVHMVGNSTLLVNSKILDFLGEHPFQKSHDGILPIV